MRRIGIVALACLALFSSPAVAQDAADAPDPAADRAYRVGRYDVVRVTVYDEDKLSGRYTVDADGSIAYPLIGRVEIAGKTTAEIAGLIETALEADYLYDASVRIDVEEYHSHKVKILGEVTNPGIYFLERDTGLFELLSKAGGLDREMEIRRGQTAQVMRKGNSEEPIAVDLYDLLVLGSDKVNVRLRDGDVVYVRASEEVHVVGEVTRPGSYPYETGMSVLKAVSLAGGKTKKAAGHAVIKRIEDGKEVKVKMKMDDTLQPDDIVEVPLSFW